jgi:hypothetical protein
VVQGQEGHHHELSEQEVGSVHFATTCGIGMSQVGMAEFDASFNKAVALLMTQPRRNIFES